MVPAVDPTISPRSTRPARNLSSPWSHVVRGEQDQSSVAAVAPTSPSAAQNPSLDPSERSPLKSSPDPPPPVHSEIPDPAIDGNATAAAKRGKKPVWNVPSNGSTEGGAVGVMDAASWPALSESARASPKSSSSDSLKVLSDGSVSGHLGPVSPSLKPALGNPNPNLPSSPSSPARYKSMKHGAVAAVSGSGEGGEVANSGLATPSPVPGSSQISHPVQDKPPYSDPSLKGLPNKNSSSNNHNWDHGVKAVGVPQHRQGGNDHHRGYGVDRRGNNGHHNSYGNRRDPDRGGYEWNNRNFVRDVHMQHLPQQWSVRPYPRPPPVAAQLIAPPPPPSPFSNNIGFPDFPSPFYYVPPPPHPESLRAMPFTHPVPAPSMMFFPAPDPQRAMLLKQIDYYFSSENLCKDTYLRQNMDEQGWVPISLIAGFNRVKQLTNNIQYIIDTVRLSSVVEVQGEKIRRRHDWATWVLKTANHFGSSSDPQSPTYDNLAAQFNNVGFDNASDHASKRGSAHTDAVITRSASGKFNNQKSVARDPEDVNGQLSTHSDWSASTVSVGRNDTF